MGSQTAQTILTGSLVAALPIAVLAGLISFLSPCVLPLVPGYLSYLTGMVGTGLQPSAKPATATPVADAAQPTTTAAPAVLVAAAVSGETFGRESGEIATESFPTNEGSGATSGVGQVMAGVGLFIAGFSTLFVAYGALFGQLGRVIVTHQQGLTRVLGVLTIVLGVIFLGVIPATQRSFTLSHRARAGLVGAPLLGVMFGLGWTPCIGPTLAAVQTLAFTQSSAARGALLSLAYCLGLGVPFLLAALAYRRGLHAWGWARRHGQWVVRLGGALLILLGLLMLTGLWAQWVAQMQGMIGGFQVGL